MNLVNEWMHACMAGHCKWHSDLSFLHIRGQICGFLGQDSTLPLTYTLIINLTRWYSASPQDSQTWKTFPFTFLPKCVPLDSPPAKPPLPGKSARREELVSKAWKASKGNEKNTSHCAHSSFCLGFACVSSWERMKSTFLKILALKRNASWAEMSAWRCPDCRTVLLSLTLCHGKTQTLPCTLGMVHRTDEISSPHSVQLYWIFITIQRFYKLHFYPSSLASSPSSQNHVLSGTSRIRCPSKPLLWTLGSAESHPFLSTF